MSSTSAIVADAGFPGSPFVEMRKRTSPLLLSALPAPLRKTCHKDWPNSETDIPRLRTQIAAQTP
eukprot:15252469-Alexandrium_andersonii.AAC.1